jgi:hypothetical protein
LDMLVEWSAQACVQKVHEVSRTVASRACRRKRYTQGEFPASQQTRVIDTVDARDANQTLRKSREGSALAG